jgi:hypothetical protein
MNYKLYNLTDELLKRYEPREKTPKRISVSEVHALINEWEDRPITVESAINMWQGSWKHRMVQDLMPDYEHEVKKEIDVGDGFTLVGMADCLSVDHGVEIKTKNELKSNAKSWEVTQAKIYAVMFDRPFKIVQPVFNKKGIYLLELQKVGINKNWFEKTINKVKEYYNGNKKN